MREMLSKKLKNLIRGDDGAALVLTLGVFFFMYIFCAGVYAIGMAVKEKIHLQNACDAAAYSAAVVQADTFSRIATLNRALGWTYQQMTRRQMDYIVGKWLRGVCSQYDNDRSLARRIHAGSGCPFRHRFEGYNNGWYIGSNPYRSLERVNLNWTHNEYEPDVRTVCNGGFNRHVNSQKGSFFPTVGTADFNTLGQQIDNDKFAISQMSSAIERFACEMPQNIDNAAQAIARANIPTWLQGRCEIIVKQKQNPLDRYTGFFEPVGNNNASESLLMSLGDTGIASSTLTADDLVRSVFKTGIDDWFVHSPRTTVGLQREYRQLPTRLNASWHWWAAFWTCYQDQFGIWHHPHLPASGAMRQAPANDFWDSRFVGANARPRFLNSRYFGPDGTITVGIVRLNTNPWYSIFRRVSEDGFYGAFNPGTDLFCFASAKAGYKLFSIQPRWEVERDGLARAFNGSRDYCVDWKPTRTLRYKDGWEWEWEWTWDEYGRRVHALDENGDWKHVTDERGLWKVKFFETTTWWRDTWKLTQSDWDAVMVPVNKGGSWAQEIAVLSRPDYFARGQQYYRFEPAWGPVDSSFIGKLVKSDGWVSLRDGRAVRHGSDFGAMRSGGNWNVGRTDSGLDWNGLTGLMLH